MAFNVITPNNLAPVENIGAYSNFPGVLGSVALSGGTKVVTIPQMSRVDAVFIMSEGSACTCTATSGNTFTLTGTGSDVIVFLAMGRLKG